MKNHSKRDLWSFREAKAVKNFDRMVLIALIIAGIISVIRLGNWWFRAEHIGSLSLFILLSLIFWYGMIRIIMIWINYLGIRKPERVAAPQGKTVAIFTTSSPGEPLEMFEKTLKACANIDYPHTTYLLDDTQDPRFRDAAERNGAVWMELVGLPGAKAGKINKAMELTDEEFILVLDPDHIPFPNFIDKVLGYFKDENIGFVQVSQAYYNQYRSFTAKGAAEQTYGFYGPTQMALFGHGSSVAIGANCTFRRKALESIGGHGIGLAEDLITAIRLHAKGWKSVYNPVIVSRGLVPEDFGSFCKQQLKWARGVYEVLFAEIPRLFGKLSNWQRISYLGIGTYYLVGVTSFFYILIPYIFFATGILPAKMYFVEFLIYWLPVALLNAIIYLYVQKWLCHPETERGIHWRGMVLKFACWPVFLLGFLLSVVNAEIPYIPTAKKAVTGFTPFVRPLIIHFLLFLGTLLFIIFERRMLLHESELLLSSEHTWGMMFFAAIAVIMVIGGIYAAWQSRNLSGEDPWDSVDLNKINAGNK